MKEIVDKTGMSKGAFYHYFGSKEQVFSEVIHHFFSGMMTTDFTRISRASLQQFYTALLNKMEQDRAKAAKTFTTYTQNNTGSNYYYLIFDAMKLLPDFKQQHLDEQKEELKAWKKMAGTAKKSGEIATQMTDEQVAKMFIYLGDGTNINMVMSEGLGGNKNQLKTLWDGLYNTLKSQR